MLELEKRILHQNKYNINDFYIGELTISEKFGNLFNPTIDTFKPYEKVLNLKCNGAIEIPLTKNTNWEKRERYYKILTIFYKKDNNLICLHDSNIYQNNVSNLLPLSNLLPKYSYHIPNEISTQKALILFEELFKKKTPLEKMYNNDKYNIEDLFIGTLVLYTEFIPTDRKLEPQKFNTPTKYILSRNARNICSSNNSTKIILPDKGITVPGTCVYSHYNSLFLKVPDGLYSINGFTTIDKYLQDDTSIKERPIAENYSKQLEPITNKLDISSKQISIPKVLSKIKSIN